MFVHIIYIHATNAVAKWAAAYSGKFRINQIDLTIILSSILKCIFIVLQIQKLYSNIIYLKKIQ